jgi:hypothetical protein
MIAQAKEEAKGLKVLCSISLTEIRGIVAGRRRPGIFVFLAGGSWGRYNRLNFDEEDRGGYFILCSDL